ncbi:MAG: tetratricopeptide repeat protein [Gemmatales bacterium]|nr:tetratricopeptide repeat protein [Gemmatales bacterium]MDW8385812.1 tetratricopeptide repeat protein [Gemmatales bacterium]
MGIEETTAKTSPLAPANHGTAWRSLTIRLIQSANGKRWAAIAGSALLALVAAGIGLWFYLTAPERWFRQGLEAVERNDHGEVERLARMLQARDRHEEAHFLLGKHHIEQGRRLLDEAFVETRQEIVESHLLALVDLGCTTGNPSPCRMEAVARWNTPSAPWTGLRPTGRKRLELHERVRAAFVAAINDLNFVVSEGPLRNEAAFLRGDCFFRLGDLRRAAGMLRYVLDQNPDHIEAHRLLASLYYDTGVMGRAIFHLEEVARLDPEDGRPHRMLGSIHKDFRNNTRAIASYRAALERRLTPPARAEVIRELAEVLVTELGQHREALAVLDLTPPEFADEPDVLVLRAECLWQLEADKTRARELTDLALKKDPELVPALTMRGKILLHEERPHEALLVLEQGRRFDPFDHRCRNQLVATYAMLAREAEDEVVQALAVEALTSAVDPTAGPSGLLGVVPVAAAAARQRYYLFMREDHMKASQIIVDALLKLSELSAQAEAEPWNAQVRFTIGSIWIQLRRPGMARMWLVAALACDPEHAGAREALARLERQETLIP